MKNITIYLRESKVFSKSKTPKQIWDELLKFCFYDEYEPEDEEDGTVEDLEKILKDFAKGAKSLKWETSEPSYWIDTCEINVKGIDFSKNDKIRNECNILPEEADWLGMDWFSIKVKGNVLLLSSNTGAAVNGEYFDIKCTKFNKAHDFYEYVHDPAEDFFNTELTPKEIEDQNKRMEDEKERRVKNWSKDVIDEKVLKNFSKHELDKYDKQFLHKCIKVNYGERKTPTLVGFYACSNEWGILLSGNFVYEKEKMSDQTYYCGAFPISIEWDIDKYHTKIELLSKEEEEKFKKNLDKYINLCKKEGIADSWAYYTNEFLKGKIKFK